MWGLKRERATGMPGFAVGVVGACVGLADRQRRQRGSGTERLVGQNGPLGCNTVIQAV